MHGIRGLLPGRQMTSRVPATRRGNSQGVVVINVAGRAGHVGVTVSQQKAGGAVVEIRRRPTGRSMASGTIRECKRRSRGDMRRIRGLLPGR